MLVLATGEGLDAALINCHTEETRSMAGCVTTGQGMLMWEDKAPEEDPGVVYVLVDKGETAALVFHAGPSITGDPRELDMPISTEVLFAIANDPRVDVTTSAEAVDAGAHLRSGRTPPAEHQRVRRTVGSSAWPTASRHGRTFKQAMTVSGSAVPGASPGGLPYSAATFGAVAASGQ